MDAKLNISSQQNIVQAITERFLIHPFELDRKQNGEMIKESGGPSCLDLEQQWERICMGV